MKLKANGKSQTEQPKQRMDATRVRTKTKKCPNCGQKIIITGITECKWCGWPLSARYPVHHTRLRKVFSWFLRIFAALIIMFAFTSYQGMWTHIGSFALNVMHNSVPWLIGISSVGIIILALSPAIANNRFDLLFNFSRDSMARYPKALAIALIFPIVAAALLVYFVHVMISKSPSNFDLAIISATIGGLVMVGGFIDKSGKQQATELINIGRWFLIASVFSTLFSLFMPALAGMDESLSNTLAYKLLFYATALSLMASAFSFPWAVCLLLPKLWKLGNTVGGPK